MPSSFLLKALGPAVPPIPLAYRTGVISTVGGDGGGYITIPASTVVGDLMVFVSTGRYYSPAPPALASGEWTDHGIANGGNTCYMRVFTKVAESGDAGTTMPFPSGQQWAIPSISVFSGPGAYTVQPTFAGASGGTITAPAVTVPAGGIVLEAWGAADTLSGGSITPPETAVLYQTYTHNTQATTRRTTGAARTATTGHPHNVGASIVVSGA